MSMQFNPRQKLTTLNFVSSVFAIEMSLPVRVLEAVGLHATSSTSALPYLIAATLMEVLPPTKLEVPYRFQNPATCLISFQTQTHK